MAQQEHSWRQALGGEVKAAEGGGEYGRMAIRTTQASRLYSAEAEHSQQVWMSHGDEAIRLPDGFISVATSEQVLAPGRASGYACIQPADREHTAEMVGPWRRSHQGCEGFRLCACRVAPVGCKTF